MTANHHHSDSGDQVGNRGKDSDSGIIKTGERFDDLGQPEADAIQTDQKCKAKQAESPDSGMK